SKVCYKVRWKGYGPEADTWQPKLDLYNVQDMVDEYKKQKAETARKKRQQMAQKSVKETCENVEKFAKAAASGQRRPLLENSSDEDGNDYDPEYGTVKDKFWKDLELGRHQNHIDVFGLDLYSKVKGCRRAAHADAVVNIQKQQQPIKPETNASGLKTPDLTQKSSVKLKLQRMCGKKNQFKASSSASGLSVSNKKSLPQRITNAVSRAKKRSSDPFSASGYTSAKRSRRSKEAKAIKGSSSSSVSSETVGVVNTSDILSTTLPATLTDSASTSSLTSTSCASEGPSVSVSNVDISASPNAPGQCSDKTGEMLCEVFKTPGKADTRPPNCLGQQLIAEEDVIKAEEIVKLRSDENFPCLQSEVNGAAVTKSNLCTENNLSEGPTGFAEGQKAEFEILKPLTSDIEKSAAIVRSHDQECLWGGACNRSDCRSNRRRNMKNGQGENTKGCGSGQPKGKAVEESVSSESVSSSTSTTTSSSTASPLTPSKRLSSSSSAAQAYHPSTSFQGQNPSGTSKNSLPSKQPQMSSSSSSTLAGTGSSSTGEASKASVPRSLFSSSRTHSSDSSFDESPQSGCPPAAQLNKQVVSETFQRVNNPSSRAQSEATGGSFSPGKGLVSSTTTRQPHGHRNLQGQRKSGAASSDITERPGLFSEGNSAFSFARQDSGFAGDSPGSATVFPSPTGSVNLSSPGKENFRSVVGASLVGLSQPVSSSTSRLGYQVPLPMEVERVDVQPDSTVATGSGSPVPMSNHPRSGAEPQETWVSGRKRNVDLPLEKIPSPNSKKDSDIDRRISTLTCDDLEDFIDQGEERFGQKESSFITNADLLQAVILNKAEVVKKAIRVSCSDNRLDFEQPDNTGHTLLMKAVQKGSIAITEMLLEYGVKVNSQQANGMTALMIAAEQNNTGLVALLLKYGANSSLYTVQADQAETAIMKAIKRQQKDVVSLMLRVGVNLAAPTCSSVSVLELAIERRNPHIEALVRTHSQRLEQAFRSRVLATLGDTVELMDSLFALQCFPLREAQDFEVKFNSFIPPLAVGEGFILFIAHTKINDKGVRCRFHGGCPISSVVLNGITQSPLTKEVNFVTSCHPIVTGCNTLRIYKQADYTSKAKLLVQAFRAKLLPC
ncbi:M-phase phosphoprotein 8, partial [Elysia marginata]